MQRRDVVAAIMLVLAVAGCQSTKDAGTAAPGSTRRGDAGGLLVALGGAAIDGSVVFEQRDNGVAMLVHMTGGAPGVYRVALHTTGNCSSRNGFSAGAPWAPAGGAPLVYSMATNSEGTATLSARIAGLTLEGPTGVYGKSVVIHQGAVGPLDAQPGVPNQRIGCAVIGAAPSLIR